MLLLVSSVITSCNDASLEKKLENFINPSKNTTNNEVKPANVKVKIFFRTRDMSGYDGFENETQKFYEVDEFSKNNKYTFCYDSEEFDSFQISGVGENLTLTIKDENNIVYSKNKFDIHHMFRFTSNEFNLEMGSTYTIELSQNNNVLFNGIVDSQGCM